MLSREANAAGPGKATATIERRGAYSPPSRCSAILEDDDDPLNAAASWLRLRFSLPAARARLVAEVAGLGGAHG